MNLTTLALSLFDHLHRCPSVTVMEAHVTPPRDEAAHRRALERLRFGDASAPSLLAALPEVRLAWGRRGGRAVLGAIGLPGAETVVASLLDRARPCHAASSLGPSREGPGSEFAVDGLILDARSIPSCAVAIDVYDSSGRTKGTANLVAVGRRVATPIVMMRGSSPLPSPGFSLGAYLRLTFGTAGLLMLRDVEGGDAAALGSLMDDSPEDSPLLPIRDLVSLAVGPESGAVRS
ncbi:MAG: hypothetical protein IV100_03415 [Myxococcales bacterium]|nr:hypothetical protein [Myxococcales bacterium]